MRNDDEVRGQTERWLTRVVVGLNLCPFAQREMKGNRVHFAVSESRGLEACLHELVDHFELLDQRPEIATTLLIYPTEYRGFEDYLDLVALADELLRLEGHEGIYQLASFHPDYCFEGTAEADPANLTNRSPYPMLHLLREDAVEEALQSYPNPEEIPVRNKRRCQELGHAAIRALLED